MSCLLDRKLGRLGALENFSDISATLAIVGDHAGAVAHQAAVHRELPLRIHGGQPMALCQCRELGAIADEERKGSYNERTSVALDGSQKGRVEVALAGCGQDNDL